MFNGHAYNMPDLVKLDKHILVQISRVNDFVIAEINKESVCIGKIFHFHILSS